MATISDFISLFIFLSLFIGIIYAFSKLSTTVSNSIQTTQEGLKGRGLDISKSGMSVKTDKRFDREDYVDATQRGFIKAMNASKLGQKAEGADGNMKKASSSKKRK